MKKIKSGKSKGCHHWGCGTHVNSYNSCGGSAYFLGIIGAAIYYISLANSFWVGVLGLLKALVWPVFVVMKILGM
jgi:hypothetical protein|tara:strand:- start:491 stop:715 length:225 start_codon:yes stop_codon:yes gene_type:complete